MASSVAVPAGLRDDYAHCARVARHYENFTVASRVLPAAMRPHLFALYAYCRGVDDLGDEHGGDRLAALAAWEEELDRCFGGGEPRAPAFRALRATIRRFALPRQPFADLIEANRLDQRKRAYATFADLRGYCRLSADPVGQLVLALFGIRDAARTGLSDATCTALQLANFWQDVGRDLDAGRLYLPLEDLERFGCQRADVERRRAAPPLRRLMAFEVERTRALFASGAALETRVPPRLGLQLRLYRLGGTAVLDALERQGYDPFVRRPRVGAAGKLRVALRALWRTPAGAGPGGMGHDAGQGA